MKEYEWKKKSKGITEQRERERASQKYRGEKGRLSCESGIRK